MTDLDNTKLFLEVIPRAMRNVRTEIRKVTGNEFTTPQYRLLAKISREPSSNQELADWLGVSAPTLTKMVDKLVERGLVSRSAVASGADRRQICIRVTAKGNEQVTRVRGAVQRSFAKRLASLPEAQKRELVSGLKVLKELFV